MYNASIYGNPILGGGENMGNKIIDGIALTIAIIGAVNWGLIGFFDFNLVAAVFGSMTWFSRTRGCMRSVPDLLLYEAGQLHIRGIAHRHRSLLYHACGRKSFAAGMIIFILTGSVDPKSLYLL